MRALLFKTSAELLWVTFHEWCLLQCKVVLDQMRVALGRAKQPAESRAKLSSPYQFRVLLRAWKQLDWVLYFAMGEWLFHCILKSDRHYIWGMVEANCDSNYKCRQHQGEMTAGKLLACFILCSFRFACKNEIHKLEELKIGS